MALPARHTPIVPADQAASRLALVVRVDSVMEDGMNGRHCAFIVTDVAEVMRPLPIHGLANMPPFVLGLSIIRGTPTPVVDASMLLGRGGEGPGGQPTGASVPTRFVVLRAGDRRVALAVGAVLGVRPLGLEALRTLPPLLSNAGQQVVAAVGTLDAQLLTVLGGSYLVPPALWETLATPKAST